MASLSIRNLDETTKKRLRVRAAENGRSMEEEARAILRSTLTANSDPSESFGAAVRRIVEPLGGVELEPLPREPVREPPDFNSEEFWS
ncbi:MAG: plasmid stabilization protein [Acidobacteria bacterium]|nr:plasmid stabilization protein [Acidobacteriota bacterium]MYG74261.1 plasmid stabilization protein [Acidobacteriota bacterium]